MPERESDLDQWVEIVFGLADPHDYMAISRLELICEPDRATLLRLLEVFRQPMKHLSRFRDDIVARAFWDLSQNALGVIYEPSVEWPLRRQLIESFEILFRDYFAERCTRELSHCNRGGDLNGACYMWWDFDCWCGMPDPLTRNPHDLAILASMKSILAIDHIACQESALHGLGHWCRYHPKAVATIVEDFLRSANGLPQDLIDYAGHARIGCVQ